METRTFAGTGAVSLNHESGRRHGICFHRNFGSGRRYGSCFHRNHEKSRL